MSDLVENEATIDEESEVQALIEDNFFNYLKELDKRVWQRLFKVKACLLALFRSLGELEKLIIYRLLYINQGVTEKPLRLWMRSYSVGDLKHSFALLQSYKIVEVSESTAKEESQQYKLQEDFKNGLISLITDDNAYKYSSNIVKLESISTELQSEKSDENVLEEDKSSQVTEGSTSSDISPKNKAKGEVTVQDLVKHAKQKLDFILLFLVSPEARKGTIMVNKVFRKIKRLKKQSDDASNNSKRIENLEKKFNKLSKNAGVISQDLLQVCFLV